MKHRSAFRFLAEGIEGAAMLSAAVVTWPVSRRWLANWGSTRLEQGRQWDGDDLVSPRVRETTRAITVDAAASQVWTRIVQFGLHRAGFYSYELLERIGGIPVKNVESIESSWQSISVGDEVLLHPRMGVRLSLMADGHCLCFGKLTKDGVDTRDASWSLYIEPIADHTCRLIVRSCFPPSRDDSLVKRLSRELEAALDSIMERRMLLTIKRLCEASNE